MIDFAMTEAEHKSPTICGAIRTLVGLPSDQQLVHRRGKGEFPVILEVPDGTNLRTLRAYVEAYQEPPPASPPLYYTRAQLDAKVDLISDLDGVKAHLKLLHYGTGNIVAGT